ncbi:unnamed protein product [Pleuronectes platessa]|uniref:RING finger protein 145 n=1 Tax=Pleuronectes platessa TaxID=8262 RepID=A0A9N7U3M3_PLEPL|nr:unnamed protein product [Pleuronectes platessa]
MPAPIGGLGALGARPIYSQRRVLHYAGSSLSGSGGDGGRHSALCSPCRQVCWTCRPCSAPSSSAIILFIVVTSTLQSMIEITDPVILALAASRNRSLWKHFRGLSMCLMLLVFPVLMAFKIAQFFHMDFWLLILVSSCILTSLQVTGTLLIYSLFMVELFRSDPIESLDEVIYWVNAVSRVLEFVVALCVVAYGTWESLFGEWSWMGASVIIIHSYFNVWLRGQSGWRSFLLRQEAAKKINSLPRATAQQLQQHNDVCSICFQEMSSGVITYCRHFFHGNCLRKWLYVQETCPMCHQSVRPTPPGQSEASGDAPPRETRVQIRLHDTSFKTQTTTCRQRLTVTTQLLIQPSSRRRGKGQRVELVTHKIKINQLNYNWLEVFGSAPMETLWDLSTHRPAGLQRSLLVPMCTKGKPLLPTGPGPGEENVTDSPLLSTPDDMEEQCDSNGAGLGDGASFCLRGTQKNSGSHAGCDGTHPLCKDIDLPELNNADKESRGRHT